jgi:integrase
MPRPQKVWYRRATGWWMVTLGGKKTPLLKGPDDKTHRELAEEKFVDLRRTKREAPESTHARVADIVEAFLTWASSHVKPDTYKQYSWYGQKLAEECGLVRASEFKPIHVTRWVAKGGWSGSTEYNARRYAFRFFSWAHDEGVISRNPLKGMKRPKPLPRQRAITDAEYLSMMRASDRDFRRLLFALRHTGARPKELRELTWDQVRDDHLLLREHKTVGKTRKPRVIHLSPAVTRLLSRLRRRSQSAHVFLNGLGQPWTANAVRLRVMRLKKKLGLADDVCAYLLRHAFGTNAIVNGVDLATVAELMGHSSTEMASTVYVHLAEQKSHLQDAVIKATSTPRGASRRSGG